MTFDWELYIQLADELISHQRTLGLHEAYLRTAISRSYYGVFCIARNFLVNRGVAIPKVDTHKFVRNKFWNSPNRVEKKVGKGLRDLWIERKDADYDEGATVGINRARTAHEMAKRVLERLRNVGAV